MTKKIIRDFFGSVEELDSFVATIPAGGIVRVSPDKKRIGLFAPVYGGMKLIKSIVLPVEDEIQVAPVVKKGRKRH